MKFVQTFSIVFIVLLLFSCGENNRKNGKNATIPFDDTTVVELTINQKTKFKYMTYTTDKIPNGNLLIDESGDPITSPYVFRLNDSDRFFIFYPMGKFLDSAQLVIITTDDLDTENWDTVSNKKVFTGMTITIMHSKKFYKSLLWGKINTRQTETYERTNY